MDALIYLAFFFGAALIIVFYFSLQREKRRTETIQSLCAQQGFRFTPLPEGSPGDFTVLDKGVSARAKNLLEGTVSRVSMKVFDFQYKVSAGKSQKTVSQTVAVSSYENLDVPDFVLSPKTFFSKLIQLIGAKDIGFDGHPLFSKRYILRTTDEEGVRRIFSGAVLNYFENLPKTPTVEARGGSLLLFFQSKKVDPFEFPEFMEGVARTVKMFSFS